MHTVFISYSSEDKGKAFEICEALERQGIPCWIAPRDEVAGQSYGAGIVDAIQHSRSLLLLLSRNSNSSPFVENEVERAFSHRIPIVTLRLEAIKPSANLELFASTKHWIDGFKGSLADHLPELIVAILGQVQEKKRATSLMLAAYSLGGLLCIALVLYVAFPSLFRKPLTIRSIAVLPLRGESGVGELQYLGDGVADEISKRFPAVRMIKVVPSSAMFGYVDSTWSYERIGQTFKVDAIVDGHVSREGDNLAISLGLFEAATSRERWHDQSHGQLGDLPRMVDQMSAGLLNVLDLEPSSFTGRRGGGCAGSAAAYDAYMKGRYLKKKDKSEDNALAVEYFKEALAGDSTCVEALVGLADALEYHYERNWTTDREVLTEAGQYCLRALALDSSHAGARAVLGAIEEQRGNDRKALELYTQANAADPANALVLTRMAFLYFNKFNDQARAKKYAAMVQELEPYNVNNLMNLGVLYAMTRQYRSALESFKRAVELRPDLPDAWHNLGYFYERVGRPDSAMKAYSHALALDNTRGDTYLCYGTLAIGSNELTVAESLLIQGKNLLGDVRLTYAAGYALELTGKRQEAELAYREGLAVIARAIATRPKSATDYAMLALFQARMGNAVASRKAALVASAAMQPGDDIVLLDLARVHALLGDRGQMLQYFQKAHEQQPIEYDQFFIKTAMDFENYRNDAQLLAIAQQ